MIERRELEKLKEVIEYSMPTYSEAYPFTFRQLIRV